MYLGNPKARPLPLITAVLAVSGCLAGCGPRGAAGPGGPSDEIRRRGLVVQGGLSLEVREFPLVKAPEKITDRRFEVSPDGKHVAQMVECGAKTAVVWDGVKGEEYDACDNSLSFSPDGTRIAYTACRRHPRAGLMREDVDKWFAVVERKAGKQHRGVGWPVFSPDSRRVAYVATQATGAAVAVIDDAEGKSYARILGDAVCFSPNSQRVAYAAAKPGGRWVVVVDGKESEEHAQVGQPVFSPDSERIAYRAEQDGRWRVVVDGLGGPGYEDVEEYSIAFSPDGRKVAYFARHDSRWFAVVDRKEEAAYDRVSISGIRFSPDGRRWAYAASRGGKWFMVTKGSEGRAYDDVYWPVFSPDSKRLAFWVKNGAKWLVVADGAEGREYDGFGDLLFTPDSRLVVYRAERAGGARVVVNGVESRAYRSFLSDLTFDGPDSLRAVVINDGEICRLEMKIKR